MYVVNTKYQTKHETRQKQIITDFTVYTGKL